MQSVAAPEARDAGEAKLALDQLRLALRNLRPNHWLMPVFVAVISLMFQAWVSRPFLILWILMVAFGAAPLGYVAAKFLGLRPEETPDRSWVKKATVAYLVFAFAWSSMGVLFWQRGNDFDHVLILLIIACTLAGNSALVGASRPLTMNGYAVYGVTLVLLPLREGGLIYDGLSLLALLFVGYMAYMSRQIYLTSRDMLTLRDDKSELIEALAKSKLESDRARERAESASRAKSEFLANMSHELRTPLNAILGFAEIIQSGHIRALSGKHHEYAAIIHDSGQHLLALINDILDLARIEAGALQLRETDMDIPRLVAECIKTMSVRAEKNRLTLLRQIPRHLPQIYADARALRQVLLNLVSNALKFTHDGGRVVVFARLEPDGGLALGVSDTGIGIAAEDHERVFQSFGQGRHDVATPEKGTGLGLPIVKGLTEAHGGRVQLDSRLGDGTTVTIFLPASRVRRSPLLRAAS